MTLLFRVSVLAAFLVFTAGCANQSASNETSKPAAAPVTKSSEVSPSKPKRWIPFYYGSDVKRLQVYYKNEGCLTYTGGNVFGGGTNKLIRVIVDPKGGCWRR